MSRKVSRKKSRQRVHRHRFSKFLEGIDRAPTENGGHTEFALRACRCGAVAHPGPNFSLVTPTFADELRRTLWHQNYRPQF